MAEHDEVDAAALHDTLESVQKQLKLLTLKEALVRDSVQDDVEGFEALKAKVEQIEAENAARRARVRSLRENPVAVKRAAAERLLAAEKGSTIYRFPPKLVTY